MADENIGRQDYIIDNMDYFYDEKVKEYIENIIKYGGKKFLKNDPDAVKVRKWLAEQCKKKGGINIFFYLELVIGEIDILQPKPVGLSLWDKQTKKQREARIKRNKKALELLINEVRGDTQLDGFSRGNEFYNWCSTIKALEEVGVLGISGKFRDAKKKYDDEIINILSCMYGVVLKAEEGLESRVEVRSDNKIIHNVANKIFDNLNFHFDSIYGVERVIGSCLRLIFPEESVRITSKSVSTWIEDNQARCYILKNN